MSKKLIALVFLGVTFVCAQTPDLTALFTPSRFDVNGVWQTKLKINNGSIITFKIRLVQTGDEVKAVVTDTHQDLDGKICFTGRFTDRFVISGSSMLTSNQGSPDKVIIDDPDHIRFETGQMSLSRASVSPDDFPCDSANTYNVKADFALIRGAGAIIRQKDYKKAACWLTISATGGKARAQSLLAYLFYAGGAVNRDYAQAFAWAQKSADQDDVFGEMIVSALYKEGKGIAQDAQKATYWAEQANTHPEYQELLAEQRQQHPQTFANLNPRDAMAAVLMVGLLFNAITSDFGNSDSGPKNTETLRKECSQGIRDSCEIFAPASTPPH